MTKTNFKISKRRIKRRLVISGLAATALIITGGFYAFRPLATPVIAGSLVPALWEPIVVPLPGGQGQIALHFRTSHPFLAEYDRWIDILLADGRRLQSPMMDNTGGRTFLLMFWQPAREGTGPFLMLEDWHGATWVNLADMCLYDSKKPICAIAVEDRCPYAARPASMDWTFFGRVDARDGNRRFIPGDKWPPDDTEISWHLWPPVRLPDIRWSFEVIQREYPRGHSQHFMDHWLILRGPNGLRLWTWFRADIFGGNLASVYWYPESQGDGPYLQIGRTKAALIDLRRGRTFRLLHSPTNNWPKYPMRPDGFAIQPDEEVADTFVVLKGEPDRFLALWRDGSERVLDPLPAIVQPGKGRHLGKIDIRRMTFTPGPGW